MSSCPIYLNSGISDKYLTVIDKWNNFATPKPTAKLLIEQYLKMIAFTPFSSLLRTVISLVFLFFSLALAGQEICNNGIDDDGDGLIDLNDDECACDSMIPLTYNHGHVCGFLRLDFDIPGSTSVKWYKDGIALTEDEEAATVGATPNSIALTRWIPNVEGTYQAYAEHPDGCKLSNPEKVEIFEYYTDLGEIDICHGDTVWVAGFAFFKSGSSRFKTIASDGCDSTINLEINVHENEIFPIGEIELCDGEAVEIGTETFDETGTYEVALSDIYGCDSIVRFDIVEAVDGCKNNFISGALFYDSNENGVQDPGEKGINDIPLRLLSEGYSIYVDDESGRFFHFATEGEQYDLELDLSNEPLGRWNLTTPVERFSFVFDGTEASFQELNFGLVLAEENLKGELNTSAYFARCNTQQTMLLTFQNLGIESAAGEEIVLSFEADPKFEIVQSDPVPSNIENNIYSYSFSDLLPFQTAEVAILFNMPDETFTGESFDHEVKATLERNNENIVLAEYYENGYILCSYDPNDKLVSPAGVDDDYRTPYGEKLTYTIRFQNTGNDVAYNVRIKDLIDDNLDMETFNVLGSSHQMNTIVSGHEVEFLFRDINLPDSTSNEPMSHGYIKYEINPQEGIEDRTLITNTANIFFDANPPIVTNTTENLMVKESSSISDLQSQILANIYPNPISQNEVLTIYSGGINEVQLEIYDRLGVNLLTQTFHQETQLQLDFLPVGVYFCYVVGKDAGSQMIKLVVTE